MSFLRRVPWVLVAGVILGIVLGIVYAWLISPVQYVDGAPDALHSSFKDQYRRLIASTYQVDGDLARARLRLSTLADPDPAAALIDQASRLLAIGDPEGAAYSLLVLAQALQPATPTVFLDPSPTPTLTPIVIVSPATMPPTDTPWITDTPFITDTPGGPPSDTPSVTDTPTATLTPTPTSTPLPTRTPLPTVEAPYTLLSRQSICDPNRLEPRLQVELRNDAGQPVPGVRITIAWPGGREYIFTGLKSELGDGYADYTMTPGVLYTVQVFNSQLVREIQAPPCEMGGLSWWGSLLLTFQQP